MANQQPEVYVSVDIEADGPIPGPYSMLSLGAVAYSGDGTKLGEFEVNLETLPGASMHPKTKAWWEQFPDAWQACRTNLRAPALGMSQFVDWLEGLPGVPIFVAWPATWDFMWVYWYLISFTGKRPFSEHGIDIRSYAMGMRARDFRRAGKNYLPKRWFGDRAHTHVALDDANEQGQLFMSMMGENVAANDA